MMVDVARGEENPIKEGKLEEGSCGIEHPGAAPGPLGFLR